MKNQQLNILFITDGIAPFVTGGMQKFAVTMVKSLVKKGHQVTLVHCGRTGEENFKEKNNTTFSKDELKLINLIFVPFLYLGKLPGHYTKENKEYSKKVKAIVGNRLTDYDLIYANGLVAFSFFNNKENVPVLLNLHGYEMYQKAPNLKVKLSHYLLRPAIKESVQKANYVLSFGGEIDNILNRLGVPKSKIIEQSNGLKKDWITSNTISLSTPTTITFIGRNERRKGIEELTKALQKLIKSNLKFTFNFIGAIPKEAQIKHQSIHYLSEIKDENSIKKHLDKSDFLICPSYAEGMPTVILEAMARGNAIIATNVGATSKLIQNNGWLIEATPQAILKALKKAILLPKEELTTLKKASIFHVSENFIYDNFIDAQIESIIQKIKN